nr:RHS repeat-associated core domain-containing protein [Longitalea luteola]
MAEGSASDLSALVLKQTEKHLFGSSRLGYVTLGTGVNFDGGPGNTQFYYNERKFYYERGHKQYELTNHLGNVLATVSDRKFGVSSPGSSLTASDSRRIDHYDPHIVTAQDYYPFGMMSRVALPNSNIPYKFGFNGKMNDNEVKGMGNQQDYGFRIYDPRIGKFLSVDPLIKDYPWYSSYQFAGNKPIWATDLDGLEEKYFDGQWNSKTGKVVFKLEKVVDQKSFLGYKYKPSEEIIVTFKRPDGDQSIFSFTPVGHIVRNNGINERVNKIAEFEAFKTASAEAVFSNENDAFMPFGGEKGAGFYSNGALSWNFWGNFDKDFHDHGGAYTLNARIKVSNQVKAANQGNEEAGESGSGDKITLYRGINESHKYYKDALKGNATPNQGNATPLEHNTKSTLNSPYTSWTTDRDVAENFALRPFGKGIVLTKTVPVSETVVSPNTKKVNLIQKPGKIVSESEVLIKGKVTGAKVEHVKKQ